MAAKTFFLVFDVAFVRETCSFLSLRIMEIESQEAQVFCPLFLCIKDIALTLCAVILTKRNYGKFYFYVEK